MLAMPFCQKSSVLLDKLRDWEYISIIQRQPRS